MEDRFDSAYLCSVIKPNRRWTPKSAKTQKPLIPTGFLHNHVSGIDLAFEHENDGFVRASVLMHEGDYAKAERYFKLGMSLGYRKVSNQYATALDTGWIGRVDEDLAYAVFQDLAYKRYPIAMYNYGWMILAGHGTRANPRRGYMWIDRAADAECPVAMTSKGVRLAYESGDNPDFKSAFELFSKAAGAGEETAIYQLGLMYLHGYHVKRNYAKAAEHFQKAIDLGDGCFPEHHLARCYHAGKDEDKAQELVSLAIEHGLPEELVPSWYITDSPSHPDSPGR